MEHVYLSIKGATEDKDIKLKRDCKYILDEKEVNYKGMEILDVTSITVYSSGCVILSINNDYKCSFLLKSIKQVRIDAFLQSLVII
ncbi:hypothetical protein PV797_13350 [Clostridiaceae bacterium M8S5]|nr:hypothetical protein PV797_13350 [Clostridiaceae bacterium M8S5]